MAPPQMVVRRRELHFSREQINLIKENVCKGATDDQLGLFLHVCKKHRLDPLSKQIYCVLWPRENGKYHDMVIITGINGLRTVAARDHKDFAGTGKPQFTLSNMKTPAGRQIPESCTMQGYRTTSTGRQVAEVEVFWDEFAPRNLSEKRADFWNRMPRLMLAKCAEAQVLRKAFPDLSDVYVEEEISQRMGDYTPGGREIVLAGGTAPSGRVVDEQRTYGSREASQNALRDKLQPAGLWCDKHNCPTSKCPSDDHTREELAAMEQAEEQAKESVNAARASSGKSDSPGPLNTAASTTEKNSAAKSQGKGDSSPTVGNSMGSVGSSPTTATPPNDPMKWKKEKEATEDKKAQHLGTVKLDLSDPNDPIVWGDISNLTPEFESKTHARYIKGWWHLFKMDVPAIRATCEKANYRVVEEQVPAREKGSGAGQAPAKASKGPEKSKDSPAGPTPVEPEVWRGTLKRADMVTRGKPHLVAMFRQNDQKVDYTLGSWDQAHWDFLLDQRVHGKPATLRIRISKKENATFYNIVGLVDLNGRPFDEDGKTPALKKDREPGGRTLWG